MSEENSNLSSKSYHIYDLDATKYYFSIKHLLETESNLKLDLNKEQYLKIYAQHYLISKNYPVSLIGLSDNEFLMAEQILSQRELNIIEPSIHGVFNYFILQQLICSDIDLIKQILNHHLYKYKGSKLDFINMTRFFTRSSIKQNSPRLNEEIRLKEVSNWATEHLKDFEEKINFDNEKEKNEAIVKLFKVTDHFFKILEILRLHDILNDDGSYKGLTNYKTEIILLIEILDEKGYLIRTNQTKRGKIFCDFFGVKLSDRSLRDERQVHTDYHKKYNDIIPSIK